MTSRLHGQNGRRENLPPFFVRLFSALLLLLPSAAVWAQDVEWNVGGGVPNVCGKAAAVSYANSYVQNNHGCNPPRVYDHYNVEIDTATSYRVRAICSEQIGDPPQTFYFDGLRKDATATTISCDPGPGQDAACAELSGQQVEVAFEDGATEVCDTECKVTGFVKGETAMSYGLCVGGDCTNWNVGTGTYSGDLCAAQTPTNPLESPVQPGCISSESGDILCYEPMADNCGKVNGATVCMPITAEANCGSVNGRQVCLDAAGCYSTGEGGVVCPNGAVSESAPPAPDNGTVGVPATPNAQIVGANGQTFNYYNGATVQGSALPPDGNGDGKGDTATKDPAETNDGKLECKGTPSSPCTMRLENEGPDPKGSGDFKGQAEGAEEALTDAFGVDPETLSGWFQPTDGISGLLPNGGACTSLSFTIFGASYNFPGEHCATVEKFKAGLSWLFAILVGFNLIGLLRGNG